MGDWTEKQKNATREQLKKLSVERLLEIAEFDSQDRIVRVMAQTILVARGYGDTIHIPA